MTKSLGLKLSHLIAIMEKNWLQLRDKIYGWPENKASKNAMHETSLGIG